MTDTERYVGIDHETFAFVHNYRAGWREAVGCATSYSTHQTLTEAFKEGFRRGERDKQAMSESANQYAAAMIVEKRRLEQGAKP